MNPKLAIEKGIAVVYQELIQLEALTVVITFFRHEAERKKSAIR